MRLDAHVHFWRYNEAEYEWIGDSMAAIRRDFLPPDWREVAGTLGFDGLIAVQARQTFEETQWLLELADEHPQVAGVVGWADLRSPALDDQLDILADHTKLVGLRHIVQSEPDPNYMLDDLFLRGIARVGHHDLVYDILIVARQLPAAIEMVGHFPRQRFVLNHIAKPDIRAGEMEPWASNLHRLAEHEHVWCKLSGMATESDWAGWTPDDLHAYLDVVLDAFGHERLMIGSDWPVCLVAGSYARVMGVVMAWMHTLPEDAQRGILGENCARAYGVAASST